MKSRSTASLLCDCSLLGQQAATRRDQRLAVVVVGLLAAAPSIAGYDGAFWHQWSDGKAEVDTYKLTQERYGEPREGVVVAIVVTEPWSASKLVKDDGAVGRDRLPVLKLHTLKSFQTGIYDYHLSTTAFINLEPLQNLAPGGAAKLSFSAQEWCGQVYHEITDDGHGSSEVIRSYFPGESVMRPLTREEEPVLVEDALLLWARGLAGPALPLTTSTVRFQSSLERARLLHQPVERGAATVTHVVGNALPGHPTGWDSIDIAAGHFERTDRYRVVVGDRTIDVVVEQGGARRVLKVDSAASSLELVKSERLAYWQMNHQADVGARAVLGLSPTPLTQD